MSQREMGRSRLFRLCGLLLLAGVVGPSALSQVESLVPGISISNGLAPSLTDDPQTSPVTTLATDLLAPQRPFIFDPSGASVISNALNPFVYASTSSASLVETDTQVRDSSQTGHANPYLAAAQRLGISFSASDDLSTQDSRSNSTGFFSGASTGQNQNLATGTGDAYQSSWGASSSFGSQSEESSWGTHRLNADRSGNKQPGSLAAIRGGQGGLTYAGNSIGSTLANRSGSSISNNPSLSSHSLSGGLTRSASSRASSYEPTSSSSDYNSRNGSGDALAPGAHSGNGLKQNVSGNVAGSAVGSSGTAVSASATAEIAKHSLSFFPQAAYTQSVLGESPFSSPAGVNELHFLNPNIYAATSQGHSSSFGEKENSTDDSLRQAFVRHDRHATESARSGLSTHPGIEKLDRGTGLEKGLTDKSRLERSPLLGSDLLKANSH